MNPLLLLIPVAAVVGGGVILRKQALAKAAAARGDKTLPIPGGTGVVVVPASTATTVPNVTITQLPPAIQAALNTPGAPPNQSFLNALAIGIASGTPGFSDPATVGKARNGIIFDPTARTLMSPVAKAGEIQAGDTVTFSPSDAGMQISSIPGGSSVMLAQASSDNNSVSGIFIDARIPENTPVTIPLNSITGISPG